MLLGFADSSSMAYGPENGNGCLGLAGVCVCVLEQHFGLPFGVSEAGLKHDTRPYDH